MKPILYIVIPCYNEEKVLPITSGMFLDKVNELIGLGKISEDSRIMFVNDGSKDDTWNIICELAAKDDKFLGISQSRNRGHQNAVLAGLMEAKDKCDITISIDCDGQDDINAMNKMVDEYFDGSEIVYVACVFYGLDDLCIRSRPFHSHAVGQEGYRYIFQAFHSGRLL